MSYSTSEMTAILSNRVLKLERANSDRDYSGGGWYEEINHAMYLYPDMSFRYRIESFRSVTGGGLSLPHQSENEYLGTWEVTNENFKMYLIFTFEDNSQQKFETENLGTGMQRLNDQTWLRYLIE